MTFTFNQENNSWYETDENGKIRFISEKPTNMTNVITREVDTGKTIDDPNSLHQYYTVGDGYKKDISERSLKKENFKKNSGVKTLTKISKEKRALSRNTDKQRIKNYER